MKGLYYQPDQPQQPDKLKKPCQSQQTNTELPLWIESEDSKKRNLNVKDNELKTSTSYNQYNFNDMKKW